MKTVREIVIILIYMWFVVHFSVVIAMYIVDTRMPTMMDVLVILANLITVSLLIITNEIDKLRS